MLFGLAAFLGAFLLFLIQPFMGKVLTPIFGGGAGVWISCLVFFQTALMGGYALAHGIATRISRPNQALAYGIMALLVVLSLLWSASGAGAPMLVPEAWRSAQVANPASRILLLLLVCVGPLFVLLAATAPLVQAWYTATHPERSPYRLYALSNAGSLAGLLAYPFAVEPFITLKTQAWLVAMAFPVVAVLMFFLATKAAKSHLETTIPVHEDSVSIRVPAALRWVFLAAAGSALLVSITQVLAWTLATTPLVWVLPLAAFLLTFIVAFRWEITPPQVLAALLVFLALCLASISASHPGHTFSSLAWGLGLMLSGGLLIHGRLAGLQPPKAQLTFYYVFMSMGGALGGAAAALLPPLLFERFYELPLALGATALVAWGSALGMKGIKRSVGLLLASLAVGTAAGLLLTESRKAGHWIRDFYGAHAVMSLPGKLLMMVDGQVNHGMELLQEPRRPIAYYDAESGVGRALRVLRSRKANLRIGVVGLGGGGMAANAMAGDELVFFEISPEIIRLSQASKAHPPPFTFLAHCPAKVEVQEGDGRALLRQDQRTYDLLMLDAFSGGNIPAHLITREAIQLYLAHLNPGGLLVFNTSNRMPIYRPILTNVRDLGAWAVEIIEPEKRVPELPVPLELKNEQVVVALQPDLLMSNELLDSAWILVGPGDTPPTQPAKTAWAEGVKALRDVKPWTDGRSSLSDVMFKQR